MGVVAGGRRDARHAAVAQGEHGFVGVEVQRAAPVPLAAQRLMHFVQRGERWRPAARPAVGGAPLERGGHFVIAEPRLGLDDGFGEGVAADAPGLRHLHVAHQRQPLFVGLERANAVGQRLRQHGNHPVRQVNGIAAAPRFDIERGAGRHIVRHIRDGHQQPPAAAPPPFGEHGVVEILGVRAIDGDERQVGEIEAAGGVRRGDLPRRRLGNRRRPLNRHGVARQHGRGRPVGLVARLQHPHDASGEAGAPLAAAAPRRIAPQQPHRHDVAVSCAAVVFFKVDGALHHRV